MSSLGHFGEYDEYLRMLAEAQRYKLRVNAHKGFLGDVAPDVLLARLKDEIIELEDAAKRGSKIEMILEAADIANFALGFVVAALKPSREEPEISPSLLMPDPIQGVGGAGSGFIQPSLPVSGAHCLYCNRTFPVKDCIHTECRFHV